PPTKRVLGDGLLTSDGDFHHRQRQLIQPFLHRNMIASYGRVMIDYTRRACGPWRDGEVLDMHQEMSRLTMAIVAKCLFNADVEAEAAGIGVALNQTMAYYDRRAGPLGLVMDKLPLPLPGKGEFAAAVTRLEEAVYKIIRERRASGADAGDLLSSLLKARDEEGGTMTDAQLRDETLTLLLAGHETTANALTWAWYLLSQNREAEEKLHRELDGVLPEGRALAVEDYQRLEYTARVFKEALRLYPPAWALGRRAVKDCGIGGFLIPAGSTMVMSQYVMHRDPRFFDDPESFDPDRWTPEMEEKLPDFAYFPFGGGPRGCVGESFAKMEGVLVLAAVARSWAMKFVSGQRVGVQPRITLRPKYGMKMKLERR
ncbi:MAG: cytochrome P450, partial [Nitrososphaerota archaeon]|nr:cytochrome P450 [Nitrososphaerota archaeon]